jgi:hypothetical protein
VGEAAAGGEGEDVLGAEGVLGEEVEPELEEAGVGGLVDRGGDDEGGGGVGGGEGGGEGGVGGVGAEQWLGGEVAEVEDGALDGVAAEPVGDDGEEGAGAGAGGGAAADEEDGRRHRERLGAFAARR